MYSKTLPERTPFPRPSASGMRRRSASESRWSASDSERGAYGISSSRSPSSSPSAHSRSASRKSPRKRRHDVEPRVGERLEERPRVAPPEEAAGVREPEPLGRRPLEPHDVVEVAAVRDRHDRPARAERPRLLGDRLRDARDRVGARGDELRDTSVRRRLRLGRHGVGAAMGVRDERVAEIGDPACARRAGDRRGDEVRRGRRRRRHDHVDLVLADEPDARRDRRHRPRRVLVRQDEAPQLQAGLRQRPLDPVRPGQHLARLPAADADVARPVHPGLRRHPEPLVAVQPARVVGREDVGLDPHRRQVLRELQRPLDAAAARRREVEADDQRLHGRRS